ncbi:MAG TPA: Plug domain-containing protein, partial [Elusimicrobiota bacterium]|nr:Plug domain-containing protein [Elusimicrobiota bacterium]
MIRHFLIACAFAASLARPALADDGDAFQFFQEEAEVVTASRRPQLLEDIPMAVDVVTAEEIRASGATTIADLLRYRVGMDVLDGRSVDGQRSIVAIRGFPQEWVHNIQVLIDGRSVYDPISGSNYWE